MTTTLIPPQNQKEHHITRVTENKTLSMTVAICTRSRTAQLKRALASLRAQHECPAEILVIDNAPFERSTQQLIEDSFPNVRYVIEPVRGLDRARNCALKHATHEIVAFIDDDAVAEPHCMGSFFRVFKNNELLGLCTGRVSALTIQSEAQALFEANGGYDRGNERISLPRDKQKKLHGYRAPLIAWAISVGNGTSFALRRSVALRLGGFDEALDQGPTLHGGGDLDMFWRILNAGYELMYEPTAHACHEHRTDMKKMVKQLAGHQRALVAFLCKSLFTAHSKHRGAVALFLLWRLIKPGVRIIRRLIHKDPLPLPALIALWAAAWHGLWRAMADQIHIII